VHVWLAWPLQGEPREAEASVREGTLYIDGLPVSRDEALVEMIEVTEASESERSELIAARYRLRGIHADSPPIPAAASAAAGVSIQPPRVGSPPPAAARRRARRKG